ncbi:hypothetical protein V8F33_009855 [Rhypophila sp. PSN 637]
MKTATSALSLIPLVLGLTTAKCSADGPMTCFFTITPNAHTPTCPSFSLSPDPSGLPGTQYTTVITITTVATSAISTVARLLAELSLYWRRASLLHLWLTTLYHVLNSRSLSTTPVTSPDSPRVFKLTVSLLLPQPSKSTPPSQNETLAPPATGKENGTSHSHDGFRLDVHDALTPDPETEDMYIVKDNKFAFSPGQLSRLFNPKSCDAPFLGPALMTHRTCARDPGPSHLLFPVCCGFHSRQNH